jgi:transcriptional regulator with XRE-family HTH domain
MSPKLKENRKSLSEYVDRVLKDKNLSTYDVERLSGKAISQSTVNRIANGEVQQPGPDTLKALAKGLDVPESELFAIVRGVTDTPKGRFAELYAQYNRLGSNEKKSADYLIEILEREISRLQKSTD